MTNYQCGIVTPNKEEYELSIPIPDDEGGKLLFRLKKEIDVVSVISFTEGKEDEGKVEYKNVIPGGILYRRNRFTKSRYMSMANEFDPCDISIAKIIDSFPENEVALERRNVS